MMRPLVFVACLTAVTCLSGVSANAAIIEQLNTSGSIYQLGSFAPLSQSFIVQDAGISEVSFAFGQMNNVAPNNPITISLHEGIGVDSPALASTTFTLDTDMFNGFWKPVWVDTALLASDLTIGGTYSLAVSTTGGSSQTGLFFGAGNTYAGGTASTRHAAMSSDLAFRVVGSAATPGAVPEPASWAMMIGGLGLVGGALRRQRARQIAFA